MNFVEQKNYDINSNDSKNFSIEDTTNTFISKYYILLNEYINLYIENIYDNITITNNNQYRYYIICKGLEMLSNIMLIIIMHTNNIDLSFYYCNKGYYYYLEFISQIDIDNNQLELNIKDAILFVYKKTIFEIKELLSTINNSNVNVENIQKLENIRVIINIINSYIKIFKIKNIINHNIHDKKYIDSETSVDKQFLKLINKIEKSYKDEQMFNIILINLDNIFSNVLQIFNKFNIIDNDNEIIDDVINFNLIIVLIDKIFSKIIQDNKIYKFENIIETDILKNLSYVKIRQILLQIK